MSIVNFEQENAGWVIGGMNEIPTYMFQSQPINSSRPDPGRKEKINWIFYFHGSLWCLKRFYEDLKRPS